MIPSTQSEPRYSADYVTTLSPAKQRELVNGLSLRQSVTLLHDWSFWARPNQLPPSGDWLCWLMLSGRGGGKTRAGSEWVLSRVRRGFRRIALIGQTKADVRDTMIELGDSAILNVSPPWEYPEYQPSKRRIVWPNGAVAIAYSGDEPGQLRGPQHDSALVDELAKFKYPEKTYDNLEFGLRIGPKPQIVVTTTPRPIPIIRRLVADPSTVVVRSSTYENVRNLAPSFVKRILERYEGTRLGRQELHGEILEDNPGALWERSQIHRVFDVPELSRLVVAVDPSGSSTGDECGIVVCGIAEVNGTQHFYVVEDLSLQASSDEWSKVVVTAYHKWKADKVVAEANFGGDMVSTCVHGVVDKSGHQVGRNVPVELVHASRGKRPRAEPVAQLYAQGRGHHVGSFSMLEDELCQWEPGQRSPGRLDAMVWGATELIIERAYGGTAGVVKVRGR